MRMNVIAGIFICAKTVGAKKAYFYLRYEYRNLASLIEKSVQDFKNLIKDPEYDKIQFELRLGAGTYIAGEETAMFESIQGNMPNPNRNRPWFIFSTESGLFKKPTVVNNVETFLHAMHTLANPISKIKENHGIPKLIGVTGDLNQKSALIEYSLQNLTPAKIISDLNLQNIAAAEIGGITEQLIFESEFEKRRISYNKGDLNPVGSTVFFNKERNLLEIYKEKLDFMQDETCRQCTPCKEATNIFSTGYKDIIEGKSKIDEKFFKSVAFSVSKCGQCGHGKALGPLFEKALEYKLSQKPAK